MPRTLSPAEVEELKARILDAAERVLIRDGVEKLTLRALAVELGASQMLPYRYFKDKDDIVAGLRWRGFTRFAECLEAAAASPGDPLHRSQAVGDAYVAFAIEHPGVYRLMFDLAPVAPGRYPDLDAAKARARRTMTDHVERLIEAGILAGDPEIIGRVLWAGLHGLIVLELSGQLDPNPSFAALRQAMFTSFFKGLRPVPPASPPPGSSPAAAV